MRDARHPTRASCSDCGALSTTYPTVARGRLCLSCLRALRTDAARRFMGREDARRVVASQLELFE